MQCSSVLTDAHRDVTARAVTNAELQRHLFPPPLAIPCDQRPMPDWAHVHAELRRPGVTLALLWQEYRLTEPAVLPEP